MKKIIVIGGGFAGLSAASFLLNSNNKVTLIEASPKLGGRAYSFNLRNKNEIIDNGQHIMMGCYQNTFKFLEIINALDKIEIQEKLNICFVERGGRYFELKSRSNIYPLNLVSALLRFAGLPFKKRLKLLGLFTRIIFPSSIKKQSVKEYLANNKQDEEIVNYFWEILNVGIMNSDLENSSAEMFINVLRTIFFTGNKSTKIVIPKTNLSQMYAEDAAEYIKKNSGKISLSERVLNFHFDDERIITVETNKRKIDNFDYIVSAMPPYSLNRLLPETHNLKPILNQFNYSPILSINIWLSSNPFEEKFCALINSKIHWVFNHGSYISLVTSSANKLVTLEDEKIMEIVVSELTEYFPLFYSNLIIGYKIIKEKRATFVPDIHSESIRKLIEPTYNNLIVAGDWTNTNLPSTIESAVLSGLRASGNV